MDLRVLGISKGKYILRERGKIEWQIRMRLLP